MSVFQKILKAGEGKRVRQLAELVGPINELAGQMAALTDAELRAQTDIFRARLAEGETLDDRHEGPRAASLRRAVDGWDGSALWMDR